MMGSFRRHKWEEMGRPKELYYDESSKMHPFYHNFPCLFAIVADQLGCVNLGMKTMLQGHTTVATIIV
jgi:hypothetical protein